MLLKQRRLVQFIAIRGQKMGVLLKVSQKKGRGPRNQFEKYLCCNGKEDEKAKRNQKEAFA